MKPLTNEKTFKPAQHEKSPLGDLGVRGNKPALRQSPPGGFKGKRLAESDTLKTSQKSKRNNPC
jgi:hypothetical protein